MTTCAPQLPTQLQTLWDTLDREITWLHGRWIIYKQLYGTSPERIDVLNSSAASFFYILEEVLMNDVQLALSKLDDPAGKGERTNMTLNALLEGLKSAGETAAVDKMTPYVQEFSAACRKLRHRRNKSIAHFDLSTMLNSSVTPLTGASRSEIEVALTALRGAMNSVNIHYTDVHIGYEHFSMAADGVVLLENLMRGIRYRELVDDQTIPRDDFRKRFKRKV